MRSFFTFFLPEGNLYSHRCSMCGGTNIKPSSDQLHPLLHAEDADTNFERRHMLPFRPIARRSMVTVADFQDEIRAAINSYFGFLTPRMSLDVRKAFLYHAE